MDTWYAVALAFERLRHYGYTVTTREIVEECEIRGVNPEPVVLAVLGSAPVRRNPPLFLPLYYDKQFLIDTPELHEALELWTKYE